jgi:hypothetical protein
MHHFRSLTGVAGSLLLLASMTGSAGAATTSQTTIGAACVPNGDYSDIEYTLGGMLVNKSTSATKRIICASRMGGSNSAYSATVYFNAGAGLNGGTECALRATDADVHAPTVLVSSSGTWLGGSSPLSLTLTGLNSSFDKTEAVLRCILPVSGSSGDPGVGGIKFTATSP